MFIQKLSAEQQGALLSVLKMVMASDGNVSADEEKILVEISSQFAPGVVEKKNLKIEQLASIVVTRQARSSFMLELLGMALADAEYHEDESHLLGKIASIFGFSEEYMADMKGWVTTQLSLAKAANVFFED